MDLDHSILPGAVSSNSAHILLIDEYLSPLIAAYSTSLALRMGT
jgi:hypothetical protein